MRSGLLEELSECFIDRRDQRFVEHTVHSLISQRVNGLVLGYEDLNDHEELRRDPLHGLIAGKSDPLGQDRIFGARQRKSIGGPFDAQPAGTQRRIVDNRYHKIQPQPEKIEALLIRRGIKAIPRKTREIVLDFDATDDPLHVERVSEAPRTGLCTVAFNDVLAVIKMFLEPVLSALGSQTTLSY